MIARLLLDCKTSNRAYSPVFVCALYGHATEEGGKNVLMQKVSVQNLRRGMTTHNQLRTADGQILLGSNVLLNERYIQRIQALGICSLSITNPIIERLGLVYDDTLPEEKKAEATKILKHSFEYANKGGMIDVPPISALAKIIADTVRKNQIIRINNITAKEDYVYTHCVNVAALVAVIAADMDYNELRTHELIMGALLHDIGEVFDSDDVKEEDHAQKGFDYVRKLRGYSAVSGHVVFQHHEKYDGTGYPRKLCGDQIHEYARITAVADAYDTLVSDHKQKELLLPHQAYEALMAMSESYLDREIVNMFLTKAPLYPIGTFVVLDSGHIGIVTEARPKLQSRPKVVIITDEHGAFVNQWLEINLAENLTTFIMRVMSEEEVIALTKSFANQL